MSAGRKQQDTGTRPAPSPQLTELLGKALLDKELGDRIFVDPEAVAQEFDLPRAEAKAIRLLDRRKFEATIDRLRWG